MLISLAFLATWKYQWNYTSANQNHILWLNVKISLIKWKQSHSRPSKNVHC